MRYYCYRLWALSMGLFCLLTISVPAYADCISPPGKSLDSFYNPDLQRFVICQGTKWMLAAQAGAAMATQDERTSSWWLSAFPKKGSTENTEIEHAVGNILKQIKLPPSGDFNQTVDAVRQFVHNNSAHNIDEEFYSYWNDIPELLRRMDAAATDPRAPKPHMECATRTALMYHILHALSIRSRPIVIFADGRDNANHTYLSVNDPRTGSWHIQDADYNVFWMNRRTEERASTIDLLFNPVEKTFIPCTAEGQCGYTNNIQAIIPYFSVMAMLDIDKDDYATQVNLERFDADNLKKFMSAYQPYCELFSHKCNMDQE